VRIEGVQHALKSAFWLRYYADALQEGATEAQKPVIKQEVLDPEEMLREAEEQAGDDGGEQVALGLLARPESS